MQMPLIKCKPYPSLNIIFISVRSEPIPEVEHESQLHKTETKVAKITAATPKEIYVTESSNNNKLPTLPESAVTATDHNTDNIEKSAIESTAKPRLSENKEVSSVNKAQAKLSQSIDKAVTDSIKHKMKDINLNNEITDSAPSADANDNEVTLKSESVKEEIYKNEKVTNNPKDDKKSSNNINIEDSKDIDANDNVESDTDKVSMDQKQDAPTSDEESKTSTADDNEKSAPSAPKLKYKYDNDQWSPLNQAGKKCYDIGLLMQIKDDPLSKTKPNAPMLEVCNIIKPHQEPQPFNPISRPINDSLFPNFAKNSSIGSRSNTPRDPKKDGRNLSTGGKGSMKLNVSPSGSTHHKAVIRVSLTREDVKLNQSKDAWKPTRLKAASLSEEEFKTQELYKKFRGILNKLTPQKFDTLMEKVKTLEINTQSRLEGVIDLVFEKAIDEPNFSEAYANMCNKLASIKVPADNGSPDKYVNFRLLIISKCQNQFVTDKVDENVLKLEKEMNDCTDPVKKKELQVQVEEENRKLRMRSVGNVRFIGELYKLKMLTAKIMVYCMNYLVDKLEEEKLECLCKLLTTIGEQVENEVREQLELVFKQMQEIVDKKSNKISSRVRFMIKDVIELRQRRWVVKSVVDSQPKMMDQIQKEAEQQQRHIELMNSIPMGGGYGRREDGGRGKRGGEGRRQNNNSFMDNNWKSPRINTVDMSKLKAGTQKNLSNIKLAPQHSGWNHGSGTKNTLQASSNSMIGITKNKYSMLENSSTDPTLLRDMSSGSRARLAPEAAPRPAASTPTPQATEPPPAVELAQEPLPEEKKKSVRSMVGLSLNFDNDEVVIEIQQRFPTQYHAALVTEIINIVLEKSAKDIDTVAKTILHIVNLNVLSASNFLAGISEIFEFGPDLYIDIPMLYVYLSKFMTPLIENKHVTFAQVFKLCEKSIIPAEHGHLILKAIINSLKESMGVSFVKTKWQESGLEFKQWMNEDQVPKWLEDNKLEYLVKDIPSEESKIILTPAEVESKLLQLMNADETCDCVRGWIQDNVGASREEEWVTRALMAAVCSHALLGGEGARRLSRERMHKYAPLLHELAARSELDCLLAVQRLVHRLEHPQGLTLDIFQYLHEQYIISVEGFIMWETSEKEPEGKGMITL
ncbi:Eukaryotic translation initiation factor 4 gamma 3 [Papilio xuthus]|uniref:Eukaryotic translation initiation factor 4 gamma 3 n=1 Tax=Papilio xuthus TaxID=66420 RepID=A0A194PY80_PAPXU|nr:Eukaryotic translation initiation factor 4 gamma 3 [Papilio xuthus]